MDGAGKPGLDPNGDIEGQFLWSAEGKGYPRTVLYSLRGTSMRHICRALASRGVIKMDFDLPLIHDYAVGYSFIRS